MLPTISSGVINQATWPQAGDVDDCWAVAAMTALHACASWETLPSITKYREAAGNPDDPTRPDGGTIAQNAKAIRTLWPEIGQLITVSEGRLTWLEFADKAKDERPACLFVRSGELPSEHQYGFAGLHAIAVVFIKGTGWKISNPLAPAQSRWKDIAGVAVERAAKAWPGKRIYAVLMPTVEDAFKTHPLYPDCAK